MIGWFEKRRTISILMFILIIIEIFYFSSLQGVAGAKASAWIPRLYHFSIFFLLSFFLFVILKTDKKIKTQYIIIVIVVAVTYSLLDEFHQLFVPGRNASISDILTDTLGIFLSIIIYSLTNKKSSKNL